jgi:hypothetical protein
MGILGIDNRTENWKSVEHFYGLSDAARECLVRKLSQDGEQTFTNVEIELFWHGVRDYIDQTDEKDIPHSEAVARSYRRIFHESCDLRELVKNFRSEKAPHKFNAPAPRNYSASVEYQNELFDNLRSTEIDIVIDSKNHLFIGEAKHESPLGTNGTYVLVHQLIRQYVIATILVDILQLEKKVVPFLVGDKDKLSSLKNTVQVKFMIEQGWLKEENVLSWCEIEGLANSA